MEKKPDYIPELIPLHAQALFAPTPQWEAAARQALARETARVKGHQAAGDKE